MTTEGNTKGLDVLGQEVLWSSRGQQVMMQWEKCYMERCVEAMSIKPTDRVLEIGFGLAYSGSHIQKFKPQSHTIIECDEETLRRTREFAKKHNKVEVVAGTWQQHLPTLDLFDCVFFDDYPLPELEHANVLAANGASSGKRSRWHDFLDVVLKHCATGARISGYLALNLDLQRSGIHVEMSRVEVDVPEHCKYFPHKTALVPVITVVDPVAAGSFANAKEGMLLPLPQLSEKFQRAFECSGSLERTLLKGAPRWQKQIVEIRDFLSVDRVDALLHQYRKDTDDSDAFNRGKLSAFYDSQESRCEFLCRLKKKAAALEVEKGHA